MLKSQYDENNKLVWKMDKTFEMSDIAEHLLPYNMDSTYIARTDMQKIRNVMIPPDSSYMKVILMWKTAINNTSPLVHIIAPPIILHDDVISGDVFSWWQYKTSKRRATVGGKSVRKKPVKKFIKKTAKKPGQKKKEEKEKKTGKNTAEKNAEKNIEQVISNTNKKTGVKKIPKNPPKKNAKK
jgi:hypothetical protein